MATFLITVNGTVYLNVDHIRRVLVKGDIARVTMSDRPDGADARDKIYEVSAADWLKYYEAHK